RFSFAFDRSLVQFREVSTKRKLGCFATRSKIFTHKSSRWRGAPAAGFRRSTPLLIPALQPLYRRRHAHLETFSGLMARRTGLNGFDHAYPQVTRIGLRHLSPQKGESIPEDSLISHALGIPPIQIGRQPL